MARTVRAGFLRRACALAVLASGMGACGSVTPPPLHLYDLGPSIAPRTASAAQPVYTDIAVRAASWLDDTAILYRLAYDDAAQVQAYAASRWIAPPARLLDAHLRQRLEGGSATVAARRLSVELEEFSQVFDAPDRSSAVLRARATVADAATRAVKAQRGFEVRVPAPSPDARGAVHALRDAQEQFLAQLADWLSGLD